MHALRRTVRPRPVNYNERLPVIYTHGSELIDANLEAFLEAQEEEHQLLHALQEKPSKQQHKVR